MLEEMSKDNNIILYLLRSNVSTPLGFASSQENGNLSEDYGYVTQSMSSLQISSRPDSRGSMGSARDVKAGSKKKKRLSESAEDSGLKSLKEEREECLLEDIEETDGFDVSAHSLPKRDQAKNKRHRKPSGDSMRSVETITSKQGSVRPLPNVQTKIDLDTSQSDPRSLIYEKSEFLSDRPEKPSKPSIWCCIRENNKIIPTCGRGEDISEKSRVTNLDSKLPFASSDFPSKEGKVPDVNLDITSEIARGMRGSVLSVQETVQSRRSSVATLKGGNSRAETPALEGESTRSMRYVVCHAVLAAHFLSLILSTSRLLPHLAKGLRYAIF